MLRFSDVAIRYQTPQTPATEARQPQFACFDAMRSNRYAAREPSGYGKFASA